LARTGPVTLSVYDITGRLVERLLEGSLEAGAYRSLWDGRDSHGVSVASGVYIYQISAGNFSDAKKMALIR
jgi:flagellar hook assembly protein FlgD